MRLKFHIFLLTVSIAFPCFAQPGFKESQQAYSRVKVAYDEKGEQMNRLLASKDMDPAILELYLVVYKQEKELELWSRNEGDEEFILLKSFDICSTSGDSGPKRKQGDLQIPEGFYHISAWNPWSKFHLSMCINYPNSSDRVLGVQGNLGGNICIHGSCVTIGCIPLTDEGIKELYILCIEAKNSGQSRIPVTIYPARLNPDNYIQLAQKYPEDDDRLNLWSELKTAYDLFIRDRQLPEITFLENGRHRIR